MKSKSLAQITADVGRLMYPPGTPINLYPGEAHMAPIRRAIPCADSGCPDYQWNRGGVPQSRFCWEHAKQHGEVSHG